ncbi:DUF924-domain-containing protein [Thozetella sp. PMI_491]|nr:DUF924-domain-containing protein [Thozetella sp. PMI_491]
MIASRPIVAFTASTSGNSGPTAARSISSQSTNLFPLHNTTVLNSGQNPFGTWDTAPATEANPELAQALSPAFLADIRKFWFRDLPNDDHFILPTPEAMKRWFGRDESFDKACLAGYGGTLELIRSVAATADDLLLAAKPASPLDWVSLILLLDQIPRNIYRGVDSRVAFEVFDPVALSISLRAIEAGIPQRPEVKYRLAYRSWFYMPLMHSEDLAIHDIAVKQHEQLQDDVTALINGAAADGGPDDVKTDVEHCRVVMARDENVPLKIISGSSGYENLHRDIISKFGRYPHRNKVLGREPTEAETKYLEDGGQTFGG